MEPLPLRAGWIEIPAIKSDAGGANGQSSEVISGNKHLERDEQRGFYHVPIVDLFRPSLGCDFRKIMELSSTRESYEVFLSRSYEFFAAI